MSESSAQMFAGAANALVHRVLVELEGDSATVDACLDYAELEDLISNYHEIFEKHTKNAYANLPRIWRMLQGFILTGGRVGTGGGGGGGGGRRGRPGAGGRGRGRGGRGGRRNFAETTDYGDNESEEEDDDDEDSFESDEDESRGGEANGGRKKGGGSGNSGGGQGEEEEQQQQQQQHEEEDDDDYDLRGVIFGLPPKPKPRRFGRKRKRGGYAGVGAGHPFFGGMAGRGVGALSGGGGGGGGVGGGGGEGGRARQ